MPKDNRPRPIVGHLSVLDRGTKLTVAAAIMVGIELNREKAAGGYLPHRRKKGGVTPPFPTWKEHCTSLTGYSYEWCNDISKLAAHVHDKLKKSRKPEVKAACAILSNPPTEWSDDDYQGLAEVLQHSFDADTITGLFIEAGLITKPRGSNLLEGDRNPGGNSTSTRTNQDVYEDNARQTFFRFHSNVVTLLTDGDLETKIKFLNDVAEDPEFDVDIHTLHQDLVDAAAKVGAEIERRKQLAAAK